MPRSVLRRWVLSGAVVCAVFAGPVAVAQASDNDIRTTLNLYAPKIVKDENAVKKGLKEYRNSSRPLTRALKHEVSDLHALGKALRHESASTAKGHKGKKDIVKGLGLIASAYSSLRADVLAVHGGDVPASEVSAAQATDKKGRTKLKAGLSLLKA
ncbi:MAG: hypothetical protein WAL38_27385 [Solirubrobacteraceae bacterium]